MEGWEWKFYNFIYKRMVIRHQLALQDEQNHNPASNTTTASSSTAQTAQPPAKSDAAANSKTTAPSTSKNDTSSSSTKTTTVSSTSTTQKSAPANSNSKPTTSPSNLNDTKTNGSPQTAPSSLSPSTAPSTTPSSANSTKTKQSAPPVSNSTTNSTKSSTVPTPTPVSTPTPKSSNNSLSSASAVSSPSQSSSFSGATFLGIQVSFLIDVAIVLAIIAIIVIIIIVLYRRYQTRKEYNDSPQNFAHKPVLGFNEEYYLTHNKIEKFLTPERITIEELSQLSGKLYKVEFKGTQKSAVYFHRRQNTTAYFEIEVLQANGSVEIGFVPCSNFAKLKNGEESMGSSGVGVTNTGFVQAQGENIYNYSWTLAFGDVFGIGLTKENSKFSQRRAWISKNGVLLNFPPNDEMDKWLATIEISAEEKNEYNLGTEKKEGDESAEDEKEDEQKLKEKAQKQKIEGLLKKQRISLKTFNKYEYYPVIICHGNKDDSKSTVINVNVGGQIFRMYDTQFRSGLLRDKPLFGDD